MESFAVLTDTLARDASTVFMLGKPTKVDADTFEVLSPAYARDRRTVFHMMETKLKSVGGADPMTFEPVGAQFGRDATGGFFRDKRLRISRNGSLARLAALGHVYAHDGAVLFFTTRQVAPPDAPIDWDRVRLKWLEEDGHDVNVPALVLDGGEGVWFRDWHGRGSWVRLEGAQFESCEAVPWAERNSAYVRDASHVWFRDGRLVRGAAPDRVERFGDETLRQGERLFAGPRPLDARASETAFVDSVSSGPPLYLNGDLLHLGDRVAVADASRDGTGSLGEIARTRPDARPLDAIADAALRPVFGRLHAILEAFQPIVSPPEEIARRMDPDEPPPGDAPPIEWVDPPPYALSVDRDGAVVLALEDGTALRRPVSAWYTLGCHLWCHGRRLAPQLVPFPSVGTMLPRGTEMAHMLIGWHRPAMWQLAGALYRAGHEEEARVLGHDLFAGEARHELDRDPALVREVANLPRELASEFRYDRPHDGFEVTTNLAVARLIVRDGWLDAPNFRDRLDVLGVLHGTMLDTSKHAAFLREIVPAVMERYDAEPLAAVRERMGLVLEAAAIAGHVGIEMERSFDCEPLLAIAEFCLARGIHARFNAARRVELLWALDQVEQGERAARALLEAHGDRTRWPGVYVHRPTYRTTRLWLLAARTRACWRPSGHAPRADDRVVHEARLREMRACLAALLAEYGAQSARWSEVVAIETSIAAYAAAIEA